MLYFLTAINNPCKNENHFDYYHTYINLKSKFRECPWTLEWCNCCFECYCECESAYHIEYGND